MENILELSIIDKIKLAASTTDKKALAVLSKDVNINVRAEVAKSRYTESGVLAKLAYDPVKNVSYVANKNMNCNIKRDIIETNRCVVCATSELEKLVKCETCKE